MCDCEELGFEDVEYVMATLSSKPPAPTEEAPVPALVPQMLAARQTK